MKDKIRNFLGTRIKKLLARSDRLRADVRSLREGTYKFGPGPELKRKELVWFLIKLVLLVFLVGIFVMGLFYLGVEGLMHRLDREVLQELHQQAKGIAEVQWKAIKEKIWKNRKG
jgi:hypothetical protein